MCRTLEYSARLCRLYPLFLFVCIKKELPFTLLIIYYCHQIKVPKKAGRYFNGCSRATSDIRFPKYGSLVKNVLFSYAPRRRDTGAALHEVIKFLLCHAGACYTCSCHKSCDHAPEPPPVTRDLRP